MGKLPTPQANIQDFLFDDLGGPGGDAGMQILALHTKGVVQNQLFIPYGKIKVSPSQKILKLISEKLKTRIKSFKMVVVTAKHYFGSGQPIITAFDCKGNKVDSDSGGKIQGISERLTVMSNEICYIEIEGIEAAFDKICFFF